ncbi:MAG: signal peptidase II [Conexibacteraceae bacterium]|nr:signal peptidase II [Conexibacteraceae bacterium]
MADPTRRRAALRAGLVFVVVVALDQITKHTLGTWIKPGQVRHVIPGIKLVYERNTGVAFSFLSGAGALVYVVTGVALVALVGFMLRQPGRRLLWLPTGMLVGGAVGNLIDRVARGSVIDFIQLPHWPAFNFADMSITFGVIILVFVVEFGARDA